MNHQRHITLQARVALPALAGYLITLAIPYTGSRAHQHPNTNRQVAEERRNPEANRPLPDDPRLIQLAAASGRTSEAKKRLSDALAAGEDDQNLAQWLAPILIADPGWLETFLTTVPEERRVGLVQATLRSMAALQGDAVWILLRKSPTALTVAKQANDNDGGPMIGLFFGRFSSLIRSPLAPDALFDPALGFAPDDAAEYLSSAARRHAPRILQEWQAGRWSGEAPKAVHFAWSALGRSDPALRDEITSHLSPEQRRISDRYDALQNLWDTDQPDPATLPAMESPELSQLIAYRSEMGKPLPLDSIAALSPDVRHEAIASYMSSLYPSFPDRAEDTIAHLDDFGLTQEEKNSLLSDAAEGEWERLGRIDVAMDYLSRIPDEAIRGRSTEDFFEGFAEMNPQGALDYAAKMPPGKERDFLVEKATAALP